VGVEGTSARLDQGGYDLCHVPDLIHQATKPSRR